MRIIASDKLPLYRLDFTRPTRLARVMQVAALLGAAGILAGLFLVPQRTWANLLLAAYFLVTVGLAGLFFIALQYVTGAGWSVALRRVPEAMASILPVAGAGLWLVLVLRPSLYAWYAGAAGRAHAFGPLKQAWLSQPFFLLRAAVYLLVWSAFAAAMLRNSRKQDADGDLSHTRRNVRLSAGFLAVFALTFWLSSYDWIMSLEPQWYSTIFGIYNFAGLFLGGLAALIILLVALRRQEPFRHVLSEAHLHDLGKLLFAFSTFWMYIWFSQYMLIWYANIPEETGYFVARQRGAWKPLFLLNVLLNWGVPFGVLLHRGAKRSARVLVRVAAIVLLGRWLDLYLLIMPPILGPRPAFDFREIAAMLGAVSLFVLFFFRALRQAPLIPVRDPYLSESLEAYQ